MKLAPRIVLLSLVCVLPLSQACAETEADIVERLKDEIAEKSAAIPFSGPAFSVTGTVEERNGGLAVAGESFEMDGNAQIQGDLRPGVTAHVRGGIRDGKKVATSVVVPESASLGESASAIDPAVNR